MKKNNVLIVSPFPPPYGGISRYSMDLIESELINKHYHYIRFNSDQYLRFRNQGTATRNYVRIFKPGNLRFILCIFYSYFEFMWILIKKRPLIVHIHTASYFSWWRNTMYAFVSKLFRKKVLFHVHNAIDKFYAMESGLSGRFFIRLSLKIPDVIITLSHGIKTFIRPMTYRKIQPVYNGVNTSLFSVQKDSASLPQILFAGAVGHDKGAFDLVQAISEIPKAQRNFRCILVGRGELDKARQMIERFRLQSCVLLKGQVNEKEKNALFNKSHIFCLPSYFEGQPISILEGMAAGMAIISSTVGTIPEIIHSQNGILIEPGDIQGLKSAIIQLTSDRQLLAKIGSENHRLARDRFDMMRVHQDIVSLYDSVLAD